MSYNWPLIVINHNNILCGIILCEMIWTLDVGFLFAVSLFLPIPVYYRHLLIRPTHTHIRLANFIWFFFATAPLLPSYNLPWSTGERQRDRGEWTRPLNRRIDNDWYGSGGDRLSVTNVSGAGRNGAFNGTMRHPPPPPPKSQIKRF